MRWRFSTRFWIIKAVVFSLLFPSLLIGALLILYGHAMLGPGRPPQPQTYPWWARIVGWMMMTPLRPSPGFPFDSPLVSLLVCLGFNLLFWAYVVSFAASAGVSGVIRILTRGRPAGATPPGGLRDSATLPGGVSMTTDTALIERAARAVVYLAVDWSMPERLSREVVRTALAALQDVRFEFFAVPEDGGEEIARWLASHGLQGAAVGNGSLLWFEQGRRVAMELLPAYVSPRAIVAKTRSMWGAAE
jgi:hypothetical protein